MRLMARAPRDAQNVMTRGDRAEPIEVWLSQPDLEITCRIVFRDGKAIAAVEAELRAWARTYTRRNEVIRAANAAGISVHRIQQLTGLARTTIMRILGTPPGRRG